VAFVEHEDVRIAGFVLAGQTDLFRVLVERYEKRVLAMGMSFFHNVDAARDFAQDVFIKAFHNLASFEGRSRFSTWLFRIAYNEAVNKKNREKDYLSLADDFSADGEKPAGLVPISTTDSPERELLKKVARKSVRQAVSELQERFRVCIDLSFFYDMTYEEIGVVTGFPLNTIKSHVLRAKKILREKLKEYKEGVQ
jgi:RNA polymerase sigma-70 factor (ECF subfamily)